MEPKHVHHSYIWLGSITTILSVLFFGAIAFFPLVDWHSSAPRSP